MGRKRMSTTVYLDPEQHEHLKELSEVTRVPMASIIREGVDLAITQWRTKYSSVLEAKRLNEEHEQAQEVSVA